MKKAPPDYCPFVSIIIPTYHDWVRLQICLDALGNQTYPVDCYEVIIVNNDPSDTVPVNLKTPENFRLIDEPKPGSYAARNKGLVIAKGEIVGFTDSDCIPYPDWIEQAVNVLTEGAKRLAGRVDLFYKSDKLTFAEIYEKVFAFEQERYVTTGGAATANMFTWKFSFDRAGSFNELLLSGGDNEWGERAQALGIEVVYSPDTVVKHPARHCIQDLLAKRRRLAGGMESRFRQKKGSSVLMVVGSFLRPLNVLLGAGRKENISLCHKLAAINVFYFLKCYQLFQIATIRLGIRQHERK